MRRAGAIAGILASLVTIGLSAAINARFGYSLSTNPVDSEILAAASVAFDVLKALGLFFIVSSWKTSQFTRAALASVLWFVVLIYSAASAIGFAALNRSDMSSERSTAAAYYGDVRSGIDRINIELGAIATLRSSDAVATDIGAMQLKREWNDTGGCQQASRPPSWCQTYLHLKGELAEAQHREALTARRDQLVAELGKLPAISEGDPQTAVLSAIIPVASGLIRTGLVALVAIAMEVVSSTGLYISSAMLNEPQKDGDDLSRKLDQILKEQAQINERIKSPPQITEAAQEAPKITEPPPQNAEPLQQAVRKPLRIITQDGKLVNVQRADPKLLDTLRSLGGTFEGDQVSLGKLLGCSASSASRKLAVAHAAGAIDWNSERGKGTRAKLIEVH